MPSMPTLLQNPPNIAQTRRDVFSFERGPLSLSAADHARIWPYMSNVYSKRNTEKPGPNTPWKTHYYWCRFCRQPDAPKALSARTDNRNVTGRKHEATKCDAKIRILEYPDGDFEYQPYNGFPYTYTLDESDMYKINEAVKCAVEVELEKGHSAKAVIDLFLSRGKNGCYKETEAARGKYLERSLVQTWKQKLKIEARIANPRKTKSYRD